MSNSASTRNPILCRLFSTTSCKNQRRRDAEPSVVTTKPFRVSRDLKSVRRIPLNNMISQIFAGFEAQLCRAAAPWISHLLDGKLA